MIWCIGNIAQLCHNIKETEAHTISESLLYNRGKSHQNHYFC